MSGINDLADRAQNSGADRSIIELVFQRLDDSAPDLLEYVATAPTASPTSCVPLLMMLADGARFATPEVLRATAQRAEQETSASMSRALLNSTAVHAALGHGRTRWVLALLRRFGTTLWPDITGFIERTFDIADSYALLDAADLANGEEAVFFARHFYLFFADAANSALQGFLSHPNWRVRAALAEAIGDDNAPHDPAGFAVMAWLVHDPDYKVRATVAEAITRAPGSGAEDHVTMLLRDDNWHVRERTVRGLDKLAPDHPRCDLTRSALLAINADPAWGNCPAHIRPSWYRFHILHNPGFHHTSVPAEDERDYHRALLTVLREVGTGHLKLSAPAREEIVDRAQHASSWLVRHEASKVPAEGCNSGNKRDSRLSREQFRRTRNQRAIQVALDMRGLKEAITVAKAAVDAGADFVEIGDPLIKEVGVQGIEQVKSAVPEAIIVAEMMSADWGRDQVVLAAQAGADIVMLIGPATTASVSAAVEAGQRLGIPIVLDTPTAITHAWVMDMERAGVDGFAVTTNIDIGIGSATALDAARTLRSWSRLPVAVSGGFSPTDHAVFTSPDWDILIIGRSVADAVDPSSAATRIVELAQHRRERHI